MDQLFIQMRANKDNLKNRLSHAQSNLSLAYSIGGNQTTEYRHPLSVPVRRHAARRSPSSYVPRYATQSLPRQQKRKKPVKRDYSVRSARNQALRLKKAKSLEQILDSSSSSQMSGPHYWVSEPLSTNHERAMIPSYCTIQRKPKETKRAPQINRSVEFLDAFDETAYLPPPSPKLLSNTSPYIGDCDLSGLVPPPPMEELMDDNSKTVTIDPEVTKYHYQSNYILNIIIRVPLKHAQDHLFIFS